MMLDTTPEAAKVRVEALRALDGTARLKQALELSEFVRALSDAGAKARKSRAEGA